MNLVAGALRFPAEPYGVTTDDPAEGPHQPTGVAGPGSAEIVVAVVGAVVVRRGRSSMPAMATKESARQSAPHTNTQRNTSARSMPWAAARAANELAPSPRSGAAPSQ